MMENDISGKTILNPPLQIIGVKQAIGSPKPPLVGFTFQSPDGKNLSILFTLDPAHLFIANMITALKQMAMMKEKIEA